jgi:IS5 family transposase
MDQVVPWAALCALIEPFYPKPRAAGRGRSLVGLERMLRIHFLQQWYALSEPAVELSDLVFGYAWTETRQADGALPDG